MPVTDSGETLLGRTVGLLKQSGVEDIHVLTDRPELTAAPLKVSFVPPECSTTLADTLLSSRHLWTDRNIILLGDVYFSGRAIRKILDDDAGVRFFGTLEESAPVQFLACVPEIFSFAFDRTAAGSVARALELNSALSTLRDMGSSRWFWTPARIRYLASLGSGDGDLGVGGFELLRLFDRYNCPPVPPARLVRLGVGRRRFWRFIREIRSKISGRSPCFGKLWGVYMLLAEIDLARGEVCSRRTNGTGLFEEIEDHTQDCDAPEDYDRLRYVLSLVGRDGASPGRDSSG